MTPDKGEHGTSNRRQFLTAMGTMGTASVAGCSIQTPFGESSSDQNDGSIINQGETPTRQPGSEQTPKSPSSTPTKSALEPPTATTLTSNGITVEVIPASQDSTSTGIEPLSDQQIHRRNNVVCTTEQQRETVSGGGPLVENQVMNHKLNELWPGAIIPAKSVANGDFKPALAGNRLPASQASKVRNPITVGLYIEANRYGGDPEVSKVIDPPTSDNVEQARVDLLQEVLQGTSAAQMDFSINQIHSQNHLDIHSGLDFSIFDLGFETDLDFSESSMRNKLLVEFSQIYYLLAVTLPNPHGRVVSDWSVVSRNDLLITDVAFGRLLFFSAESNHSATDLKGSIKTAFDWVIGDVEVSSSQRRVFKETKLNGQAVGGGATESVELISDFGKEGMDALKDYLRSGANFGPDTPAKPIGFGARYLNGQDRANTYLTTDYTARTCQPKTRRFTVKNVELTVESAAADPWDGTLEIFGEISIWPSHPEMPTEQEMEPVWSRPGDRALGVAEGETKNLGIEETVEFKIPEHQTWSEFMEDASIKVKADLIEADGGWTGDEWVDIVKTVAWNVTEPVNQTPTLEVANGEVTIDFDVEIVQFRESYV